jgi:rubrerythrin
MSTPKALEILKSALLLELRGKSFYEKAADSADDQAVKEFFIKLAEDEISHVQILSEQYKAYKKDGKFIEMDRDSSNESVANAVLTDTLKERIAGAGFESAAISAAMGMEERAIKLYSQRADESTDLQEKALYGWLAEWETQHLEFLAAIDKEVTEALWNDNSFWPF